MKLPTRPVFATRHNFQMFAGKQSSPIVSGLLRSFNSLAMTVIGLLAFAIPARADHTGFIPHGCTGKAPLSSCGLNELVGVFVTYGNGLFMIAGSFALIFFIYGGFLWITSGGSDERVKHGKEVLLGSVVGLIIVFAGVTLMNFVVGALATPAPAEKAAEVAPRPGAVSGICLCRCEGAACAAAAGATACANRGGAWTAASNQCLLTEGSVSESECTGTVNREFAPSNLTCSWVPR